MASFADFKLSEETLMGLKDSGYTVPTPIQNQAIPAALGGQDILGAARTGSGKTLAFVVPILEILNREKWSDLWGLGALVITPTRELAYQIAAVFTKVGKHHKLSVGLVIGGENLAQERKVMQTYSIVICTPGRILDHMDKNHLFDVSSLKVVVLDEADRILDMSFAKDMDSIIEHLPSERQTLLFSATQTRSVKNLARLSLTNPAAISTDEEQESLKHVYTVLRAEEKIPFLWAFIKQNPQKKVIVFVSCCKQVKYLTEILLKNDVRNVIALHGGLSQPRRTAAYDGFERKQFAILIATDIASRGLDFPKVDWVVQLDCPDDVDQYIHRAGRTGRNGMVGHTFLVLLPEEEDRFVPSLLARRDPAIPIENFDLKDSFYNVVPMKNRLDHLLARTPELKATAQRCFSSYLSHLWKSGKKEEMKSIDLAAFATSLGLYDPPRVRFLARQQRRDATKTEKKEAKSQTGSFSNVKEEEEEDDDDDAVLVAKKPADTPVVNEEDLPPLEPINNKLRHISKTAHAKKLANKGILVNSRIKFDEEGNAIPLAGTSVFVNGVADEHTTGLDLQEAKERLAAVDAEDKLAQRQRTREKHRLERKKRKELKRKPGQPLAKDDMPVGEGEGEGYGEVTLGGFDEEEGEEEGVRLGGFSDEDVRDAESPPPPKKSGKGKKKRVRDEDADEGANSLTPLKTKSKSVEKDKRKKKVVDFTSEMLQSNVQADEDLALRLLGN